MLQEIFIKDFALIREQRISFGPGLNIITGETGAGKSVILGALALVLGSRATTDLIRSGAPRSVVEAVFNLPDSEQIKMVLEQHGLYDEEEELLTIRREITIEGKGRSFVNSRSVSSAVLRDVGRYLVDIHGQNEHQSILQVDTHRAILDRYAGIAAEVKSLSRLHREREETLEKLESVTLDETEKNRRLEILTHEIREIEKAELADDRELEELTEQEKALDNAESILKELSTVYGALQENEESILFQLSRVERLLESAVESDPSLSPLLNSLREAYYQLEETASGARSRADRVLVDPESLSIVRDRIDLLNSLLRKYGPRISDIREYLEKARREIEGIELSGEEEEKLKKRIAELEKELIDRALDISKTRRSRAKELEEAVQRELADLSMKDTRLRLSIKWEYAENGIFPDPEGSARRYVIHSQGLDLVEFLLASSSGETLRPLRKIASGGEMSRIMLALKKVIIESDPVYTMIFDEVDAGVGGAVAEAVGKKLALLSLKAQVIVITHLHQIAALPGASTHFKVSKDSEGTRIARLTPDQRLAEVARMIAGEEVSQSALEHARSLLYPHG